MNKKDNEYRLDYHAPVGRLDNEIISTYKRYLTGTESRTKKIEAVKFLQKSLFEICHCKEL